MGKQNKNIFDCQGGDFSLKSLDDSFDAEDGEWYPDNSDETDVVLAASLCKNNAAKKEKKKRKSFSGRTMLCPRFPLHPTVAIVTPSRSTRCMR